MKICLGPQKGLNWPFSLSVCVFNDVGEKGPNKLSVGPFFPLHETAVSFKLYHIIMVLEHIDKNDSRFGFIMCCCLANECISY